MSSKTKVLFRVDGNSKIGLGHIFRSLALADMLKQDFECIFFIQNPIKSIQLRIEKIGKVVSLPESVEWLEEAVFFADNYLVGNEIVVLDGYQFKTDYQKVIQSKGTKLVCIDDIFAYHFVADVIINHAGGLTEEMYSKEKYTQCFLGLEYALLQAPYLNAAKNKGYKKQTMNQIFVCLGGADPNNDTIKVLKKIEKISPNANLYVVLGASYLHLAVFETFVEQSNLVIQKLTNLSALEMIHYMEKSETMICSPSTVSYECLSVGGMLYLYLTADNQQSIFKYFKASGLAFDFIEDYPILDCQKRKQAIELQEKLLNGQSKQRLLALFKQL